MGFVNKRTEAGVLQANNNMRRPAMIKFRQGYRMSTLLRGGLLLGSLMMAQWSTAATYDVAPNGNDANSGTANQPFHTVRAGLQALAPGDTLYLRAGIYAAEDINTGLTGTSWSDAPVIAAYPGETVQMGVIGLGPDVQYLIFDGLIFDGLWIEANHIRVQNSEIHHGVVSGVYLFGSFNEIINCEVHDNGSTEFEHGLYITGSNNLVEGSQIYNNAGWGVHMYNGSGQGTNDNIVRGNEIHNNAQAGDRGPGIILSSGSGNKAYDNVIWENEGGIDIAYGASNTHVYNNTIYRNNQYGIAVGAGTSDAIIENNNIYENAGPAIVDAGRGTIIRP
jgi:parallel beta-helix repeat protein